MNEHKQPVDDASHPGQTEFIRQLAVLVARELVRRQVAPLRSTEEADERQNAKQESQK